MSTNKRVKETFDKLGKDLVITKQSCDTKKMLEDIKNRIEIKKTGRNTGYIDRRLYYGRHLVDRFN